MELVQYNVIIGLYFKWLFYLSRYGEWWRNQKSARDWWRSRRRVCFRSGHQFKWRSRSGSGLRGEYKEERKKPSWQRKQEVKEVSWSKFWSTLQSYLAMPASGPTLIWRGQIRDLAWTRMRCSTKRHFCPCVWLVSGNTVILLLYLWRLLRNRVSAQQARERKKAYLGELEVRVKDLEKKNSELDERLSTLQNENNMLRQVCQFTPFVHQFIYTNHRIKT